MAQALAAIEAEQAGPQSVPTKNAAGDNHGSRSEKFEELVDNLVLNQGMKGCNYAKAYEQYEENSAGPYLPCHVGRGGGPVCARCRCAGSSGAGSRSAGCCSRGGSRCCTAEDRYR